MFPRFSQHLLACILSQYLNPPTLCLSAASDIHLLVPKLPPASLSKFLHVSSCIFIQFQCLGFTPFQYRTFPSPYMPLNFLRPFRFIRRLPPLASPPPSYVLVVSISEPPLHQQLLACILSQYQNSSHPVPGPKKMYRFKKRRRQGPKTSSPMWAPITMEFPPHPMEARSTMQVHGSKNKPRSETSNLAFPGYSANTCRSKNIPPQGPENTQASPPIFCAPRSNKESGQVQKTWVQKEGCPGPGKHASRK